MQETATPAEADNACGRFFLLTFVNLRDYISAGDSMKFQFKEQKFQTDATAAICDVFNGQPPPDSEFNLTRDDEIVIGANAEISLSDEQILKNLRGVQSRNGLPINAQLAGKKFTVEMETGTGKTYTYINTMYELNRRYGWRKFIVIVPSVAIREGVKKTFEVTAEHFTGKYHKRIRHFVYSSQNLERVKDFVSGAGMWAMIVNVQAFNSRSKDLVMLQDARDDFGELSPIESIAQIRPIIIIDEPQSVESKNATKQIAKFAPMMTLRYSATPKEIFNQVYKLSALDAYRQKLVKKISVKGFSFSNDKSAGYIFFERVNLSRQNPTATVTFRRKGATDIKRTTRTISVGDDLYKLSNGLDEYKNFVVAEIDGAENSLEFRNGRKLFVGQVVGDATEEIFRRVQIRETIQSHLEREAELFGRGIKVLSLFFIDEVSKYRSEDGRGLYAEIFEEEYAAAVENFQTADADYQKYLSEIDAHQTHAGYFSVDKKNRAVNSKDNDVDAYDLIMRDKERLLDFREPVRFVFSHSALREGWDNPNVFQICALKENSNQNSSETRRRQEVGRGMRICVNQNGERMDADKLADFEHVNVLTVVANESFSTFAEGLQKELADDNQTQPINEEFFIGKKLAGRNVDKKISRKIHHELIRRDYLNDDDNLTGKFFEDKSNGQFSLGAELEIYREDVLKLLDAGTGYKIEDARANNVEVTLDETKLNAENFRELWRRISQKTFYSVDFDSDEFIGRAADALNKSLSAPEIKLSVVRGTLNDDGQVDKDTDGTHQEDVEISATPARIDLVGKLVAATKLTRRDVAAILQRLEQKIFDCFKADPEKFLLDAARIINAVKNKQVIKNLKYTVTDERYDVKIFFLKETGRLNVNAMSTRKNIYSYLIYADSKGERTFAEKLEANAEVEVYAKLPPKFFISTPFGNYNPDWAIVLRGSEKIYFVVETKSTSDELQLRDIEKNKIECAKKHFAALGNAVDYEMVGSFEEFLSKINRHKS